MSDEFFKACKDGDIDTARRLVHGVDIEAKDDVSTVDVLRDYIYIEYISYKI